MASSDAFNPITTEVRLNLPFNGTVYTTLRDIATEKPTPALGSTMEAELGPAWADSKVVAVNIVPKGGKKMQEIVHARIPSEDDQLVTNWEYSTWAPSNVGGVYRTVVRTVILPAAPAYDAPVPGTPMPFEAGSIFEGKGYILVDRQVTKIGLQLEPVFRAEVRSYVVRFDVGNVTFDRGTGRPTSALSKLYYRGELVGEPPTPIEVLAGLPSNSNYWNLQENGIFRELRTSNYNWFEVTEASTVPPNSENSAENPAKSRVITYPTPNGPRTLPLGTDVLFYEKGSMPTPVPEYGSAHYDATKWPNHKLVYIEAADDTGQLFKFYYAANRTDQDLYNFEDNNGESLTRTYLIPRSDYLAVGYKAALKATVGEAITGRFSDYVFADESVDRSVPELDSLYVIVRRRYLQKTRTRQFYDDDIYSDITESVTIIKAGSGSAESSAGSVTEIQPGNTWHDLEVTKTVVGFNSIKALPSIIGSSPYPFPKLLKGAILTGLSVLANSDAAAASYSESWYIYWDIVQPTQGPFETRIRRFLVESPDSLRTIYPIQTIVTKDETIGQARGYFIASNKGNTTFARAEQIIVPESIHGEIIIQNSKVGLALGQSTDRLPATPGFLAFSTMTEMNIDYDPVQTRYGLFIVSVVQLNLSGVYNGVKVPFGSEIPGNSGAGDTTSSIIAPTTPSAVMAADNSRITGMTSGGTEVRASYGEIELGAVMSNEAGAYSMPLTEPYLTDSVEIAVIARRTGVYSTPKKVFTFDLAPLAPSATITTDLTTVSGKTEPGAIVDIILNGSAQIETATVTSYYPQVETLTFAGTIILDGLVDIEFVSAVTGAPITVQINAVAGDSPDTLAEKGWIKLVENATIFTHWELFWIGATVVAKTRIPAASNDATAAITITDPNATGITPAVSADTTPGGNPVTITTAGNAKIEVRSQYITGSPLTVKFAVAFGDTPDQVAAKGEAALDASVANDSFNPSSSTNTISLQSRVLRATDDTLNIGIFNDTCEGLVDAPYSVDTAPGGTPFSVTANSSGAYSFAFSPILTNGDDLTITARDAGGTSPPTIVTASTTPPTIATAAFPVSDYDNITGTASVASVVKAYVNNVEVGSAITSGGGTYNISLATPLVRGETVEVWATDPVTPTIRSASIFITAYDLDLEPPTYEYSDVLGFFGTAPAGATAISILYPDASIVNVPILMPSRNFTFRLPGHNGEQYKIYATYPEGDSDYVLEEVAIEELTGLELKVYDRSRMTHLNPASTPFPNRYEAGNVIGEADPSWDGYMMKIILPLEATLADIVINYPGQATAPVVAPASALLVPFTGNVPNGGGTAGYTGPWQGPVMYKDNLPTRTSDAQLKSLFLTYLPIVVQITCTLADGRQQALVWDRGEYLAQYTAPY